MQFNAHQINSRWSKPSRIGKMPIAGNSRRRTDKSSWRNTLPARRLNPVLIEIASICDDNDYDEEYIKPTEQACSSASRLIKTAYSTIGDELPVPHVAPDGVGGIRLRWIFGTKEVRLNCNALSEEKSYIYHQEHQDFNINYDVTSGRLVSQLRWLINA